MSSSFNYKKKNRKAVNNSNTLDYIHKQKIELLDKKKNSIDEEKNLLEKYKKEYDELLNKKNLNEDEIEQKIHLADMMKEIKFNMENQK